MALVFIRGRREPIEIEDARARVLKSRKFGDGVEKADPQDLVNLGDEWSGEYGRIVGIEIPKKVVARDKHSTYELEQKLAEEAWAKLTPKEKGEQLGFFKLQYAMRIGDYKSPLPPEVEKKAIKVQEAFFAKNPKAQTCPAEEFGDLLPPRTRTGGLSDSMRIGEPSKPNGRKCAGCEQPLTGNLKEFCSGNCMLKARNG